MIYLAGHFIPNMDPLNELLGFNVTNTHPVETPWVTSALDEELNKNLNKKSNAPPLYELNRLPPKMPTKKEEGRGQSAFQDAIEDEKHTIAMSIRVETNGS